MLNRRVCAITAVVLLFPLIASCTLNQPNQTSLSGETHPDQVLNASSAQDRQMVIYEDQDGKDDIFDHAELQNKMDTLGASSFLAFGIGNGNNAQFYLRADGDKILNAETGEIIAQVNSSETSKKWRLCAGQGTKYCLEFQGPFSKAKIVGRYKNGIPQPMYQPK